MNELDVTDLHNPIDIEVTRWNKISEKFMNVDVSPCLWNEIACEVK